MQTLLLCRRWCLPDRKWCLHQIVAEVSTTLSLLLVNPPQLQASPAKRQRLTGPPKPSTPQRVTRSSARQASGACVGDGQMEEDTAEAPEPEDAVEAILTVAEANNDTGSEAYDGFCELAVCTRTCWP